MPDIYIAPKGKKPKKKKEKAVKQSHSPLAAFVVNPPDIRFETQERKERIILLLRRHWITNLRWIFLTLFMILAPFFLRFFPLLEFLPLRYQLVTIILWYLLTLAFILENFLSWYFNVNIVISKFSADKQLFF